MDRIADALGLDRAVVREREPDPARPVPLRPPPDVPGRPAGHLRLGRLPGADGQAARTLVGWSTARGAAGRGRGARASCSASAWRCTWRAPGPGRTRAGTCRCSAAARCWSSTGLTSQGQGHETAFAQIVASELGVPIEDVEVTTGDTRRFAVRRRHVRLAGRGDERQRDRAGRAGRAGEGAADRGRRPGGRRRTTWRSTRAWSRCKGSRGRRSRCGRSPCCPTRCGTRSTRRRSRRPSSPGRHDDSKPPVAPGDAPGLEHARLLLADPVDVRVGRARGDRGDRPGDVGDRRREVRGGARLRQRGEPDDRRGPGARRRRAGRGRGAVRADGLRQRRAAAERLVHGLPDAVRVRGARRRSSTTRRRRRR